MGRAALDTSRHTLSESKRRWTHVPRAQPACARCSPSGFIFPLPCFSSELGSETPWQLKWDTAASFPCLQGAKGNKATSGLSAIFVAAFEKRFLQLEHHLLSFKRAHQSAGGRGKVGLGRE